MAAGDRRRYPVGAREGAGGGLRMSTRKSALPGAAPRPPPLAAACLPGARGQLLPPPIPFRDECAQLGGTAPAEAGGGAGGLSLGCYLERIEWSVWRVLSVCACGAGVESMGGGKSYFTYTPFDP